MCSSILVQEDARLPKQTPTLSWLIVSKLRPEFYRAYCLHFVRKEVSLDEACYLGFVLRELSIFCSRNL
jgi:hypothetical protein